MAPLEDFESRDLAWISDFVMQQMVIMLRPMMEHLQQTDATVDYVQRMFERLGMDISEVRNDVERTNNCLAILRQGLGVQNEGKCMLQLGLENTSRTVKRLDEQMESLLGVVRNVEENMGQLSSEVRSSSTKQEDLGKQVTHDTHAIEALQELVERMSNDAHSLKDSILNSEAKMEVWQRELRELKRNQLNVVPKLDNGREQWPHKKSTWPAADVATVSEKSGTASATGGDTSSNRSGSSQQKRIAEGSGGHRVMKNTSSSQNDLNDENATQGAGGPGDEEQAHQGSRLPVLGKQRSSVSRPADRSTADGPRLRFTATMAKPPSRGAAN